MKKIEKRKPSEKRSQLIFSISMSVLVLIVFGIVIAMINRVVPEEISFFGLPLTLTYVVFGLFTMLFWFLLKIIAQQKT